MLDASTGASRAAERKLVDTIKWSRFRPFIEGGEFADPATVTLRYYLND